jgi:DNA-binding SARP family transcriptional activator/TolB-like protein
LIRLHVLGTPRLTGDRAAERRRVLAQPRRVALLAYLALRARHGPERRDTLLAMFWPESDTNHARGALRNALHFLRGVLGPGAIRSIGSEEVHVDLDLVWCDAVEFDRLCDGGDLAGALRLYDGDLLAGFFISDAPEFEHWLDGERARLRQRAAGAARALAASAAASDEPGLAILRLRDLLILEPTDEAAVRDLMRLLASVDDRGQALRAFADLEERLDAEYGLEPTEETRALAAAIRAGGTVGTVEAGTGGPPAGVTDPRDAAPARRRAMDPVPAAAPAGALAPSPAMERESAGGGARRRRGLFAVGGLLAFALAVSALFLLRPEPPTPASASLAAVLPFAYRGADQHAYLADGLADLLAANLNGAGDLRVVDPRAFLPAVQALPRPIDLEAAARAASAHGAGLFVLGSVTEAGGQLRIAAALYGPGTRPGPAGREVVVEGAADDVLALTRRLTLALLAGRGSTALGQASAGTTESLEALKAFLDGEAALRATDMQAAIDHFRRATELDSTFALAHYRLSSAAYRQGIARIPGRSARAALRHAHRLAREDSLLVAAWGHHVDGSPAEALRLYEEALVLRPSQVEADFQLGELIFHWGSAIGIPAAEAREPFERVLAVEPANTDAAGHLARIAARDGRVDDVDSLAAAIRRIDATGSWATEVDALRAFLSTDRAWQERVVEAAARQGGEHPVLQQAAALTHDLAAVERVTVARLGADRPPMEQARTQLFLAQVQLARGRYRDAMRGIEMASALPLSRRLEYRAMMASLPFMPIPMEELLDVRDRIAAYPDLELEAAGGPVAGRGIEFPHLLWPGMHRPRRLYLLGALHARLDDTAAADAVADSLAHDDAGGPLALHYGRLTRARAAASRGLPHAGLRALGPPGSPHPRTFETLIDHARPYERWLRAELLRETGQVAEALRWYGTFPDPLGRDLAYVAPSHLRRAEIHEAAGNADQAADHYRRFIGLWSDADPELQPEVQRARARLAGLAAH